VNDRRCSRESCTTRSIRNSWPGAKLRREREFGKPISIGEDVWVGGGALILPGVQIGDGAVIGAGSVVTRDVPDGVFAAGNPCRVIRTITE
jgi:maltose O-acetyltransferase